MPTMVGFLAKRGTKSAGERGGSFGVVNAVLMGLVLFVTLYPFWYCVIVSLNDADNLVMGPLYFLPRKLSLENYGFVFKNRDLVRAFFMSVARTVLGMVLHTVFTGIAAYGLSKRNLLGRRLYTTIFVIPMYFTGGMIPTYLLIKDLGLIDRFLVYIIPSLFAFYHAILFMAFYESIPESIEESARLDGAGSFTVFFRLIIPVSMPIFATVALYAGVAQWNSWFDTAIYTTSRGLVTLQSIMIKLINETEAILEMQRMTADVVSEGGDMPQISPTTVRVATMMVTTVPIMVVYPFFQRYFVKGIMLGSVKE
jgi:putative aldouronate transport system permease protein